MDTPAYITFKVTKAGRLYRIAGSDKPVPTPSLYPSPRFIGVVFTGDGKVSDYRMSDKIEEINPITIRAWMRAQEAWQVSHRADDPPMWDRYEVTEVEGQTVYKRDR